MVQAEGIRAQCYVEGTSVSQEGNPGRAAQVRLEMDKHGRSIPSQGGGYTTQPESWDATQYQPRVRHLIHDGAACVDGTKLDAANRRPDASSGCARTDKTQTKGRVEERGINSS